MRIVTWNIGGGFILGNDNKYDIENLDYFINELKNNNPDIICFQEIHNGLYNNQTKIISEKLGFKYYEIINIADSHLKENVKLSISIISKYEIISSVFHKLSNPNLSFIWKGKKAFSHDKGFLELGIKYKSIDIKVLSGHMVPFHKFNNDFLDNKFQNIRNEIEKLMLGNIIPSIICADMNFNGNIKKLLPKVFNNNFKSIIEKIETTPKGKSLDKIIISNDFEVVKKGVIKGKADHYLCFADIDLK